MVFVKVVIERNGEAMRRFTQTEQKIIEFLDDRDKRLLDGTALPHKVVFVDEIEKDSLMEAINRLASEYGIVATT